MLDRVCAFGSQRRKNEIKVSPPPSETTKHRFEQDLHRENHSATLEFQSHPVQSNFIHGALLCCAFQSCVIFFHGGKKRLTGKGKQIAKIDPPQSCFGSLVYFDRSSVLRVREGWPSCNRLGILCSWQGKMGE